MKLSRRNFQLTSLDRCPVLSVTLVYFSQTVGWIKMKLGMQVGLGPGHIVLDGDQKGHSPHFRPMSVVAKRLAGWIKMLHGTELGLDPGDFVLDGDQSAPLKKGHSPQFSAHIYCDQLWMDQDVCTWYTEVGLGQATLC